LAADAKKLLEEEGYWVHPDLQLRSRIAALGKGRTFGADFNYTAHSILVLPMVALIQEQCLFCFAQL